MHAAHIHLDFPHLKHNENNFISDSAQVKKNIIYFLFALSYLGFGWNSLSLSDLSYLASYAF